MSSNNEEYELDFVNYQEVSLKRVLPKQDRTVSKDDHRFMAKAAKAQAKEDRKRGR